MASKFKIGDIVRCIDPGNGNHLEQGGIYTVKGIEDNGTGYNKGMRYLIVLEHEGYRAGFEFRFELYTPPKAFIVIKRLANGVLQASPRPHEHKSREAAETEAKRLASLNPGASFVVFEQAKGFAGTVTVQEV